MRGDILGRTSGQRTGSGNWRQTVSYQLIRWLGPPVQGTEMTGVPLA